MASKTGYFLGYFTSVPFGIVVAASVVAAGVRAFVAPPRGAAASASTSGAATPGAPASSYGPTRSGVGLGPSPEQLWPLLGVDPTGAAFDAEQAAAVLVRSVAPEMQARMLAVLSPAREAAVRASCQRAYVCLEG